MTVRFQKLSTLVLITAVAGCTGTVSDALPGGPGEANGGGASSSAGSTGLPAGAGVGNVNPGAGNGNLGAGGAGGTATTPAKLKMDDAAKYFRVIRLTKTQWTNSVQTVLALATPTNLAENFRDAVTGNSDFNNNELFLDIDNPAWSDFQAAAEELANEVTASDATLAKAYTGTDAAGLISTLGRRAYRRPLTTAEQATYMTLFNSGSTLTGSRTAFAKGASLVIRALLQSPNFLFRTELGPAGQPLSAFEMAAKLSLWIKNSAPTDALLDSASSLGSADGAVAAAKTLLDDPAALKVMRDFHRQFLRIDQFATITKENVPSFKVAIAPELAESSYLFFDKIFSKGLGVKDIFLSTTGFVGPNMAAVYGSGVSAPGSGYTEQELGANRVGFFTQLPYLMYWARNGEPDSIHRGVTINLDVLCATLAPPSFVPPTLPAKQPGQTNRQLVDLTTGGCGQACHNGMINPIGFAFENFDGMGQYRTSEKDITGAQLPIDNSGTYAFTDGTKSYKGAEELMKAMASGPQAHLCYAKKLAGFGLQRNVSEADMPLLTTLATPSISGTGSVKQMMLDLVKQDAFRTRFGGAL